MVFIEDHGEGMMAYWSNLSGNAAIRYHGRFKEVEALYRCTSDVLEAVRTPSTVEVGAFKLL
jgi:hypothetical protein